MSRSKKVEEYAQNVPEARRSLFRSASTGAVSPRQAIKAHCQQCQGYDNVVLNVRTCESSTCPLWSYRPYQGASK